MWTLILTVVASLAAASDGARVTSVKPKCGSLAGETRLTIYGSGFSEDQFSQNNDPKKGNKVFLVSVSGRQYPCRIHKDGCTKTQIMCYTPQRMHEEDYFVKVEVDGKKVKDKDLCNGNPKSPDCAHKPQKDCTPTVEEFSPLSGNPGMFVTMRGKLYSDRRGSNRAASTNKRTEKMTRVYVGPLGAELQFPGNDTFYGLALDNETSNYGTIKCKTMGTSVGFFNASFIIEAPFGRSLPDSNVLHVSYNDKIYMFQQYTNIKQLSAHTGSTEGGLLLTIYSDYVDNRPPYVDLRAYVGDEVCNIKEVAIDESVTCEVPANPNYGASRYPGNRGAEFEYWTNTVKDQSSLNSILSLTSSSPGYNKQMLDETYFYDEGDMMDNYASKMTAFYYPPHSGVYEFYLRADDGGRLFIDGEQVVTSQNNAWAVSGRKTLDSKKRYLLEVVHYETTGNSSLQLKAKYLNTTQFLKTWIEKAVEEKQNFSVVAPVKYDIQNIEFKQFTSQSAAVQEVQTVQVKKGDEGGFRFCLYGVCTEPLTTQMSDTDLGNAISSLPVFGNDEAVNVERQQRSTPTYRITFDSKRGNFPDLSVVAMDDSSPFNVKVTEDVTGVADNDMVALSFDGIVSEPFSVASLDQSKLQYAVNSLFEAKCPDVFSSTSQNLPKHHDDFEVYSGKFSGMRVKDTEPFCGRYSLKTPAYIYQKSNTESGIMLSSYGTLCFAYKGPMSNYIRVTFSYKPSVDSQTQTINQDITFKTDLDAETESWSYVCLNVQSKITDVHPGGIEYRLHRVAVHNKVADEPGYVDSVFIGQKNTTNDPDINLRRLRPALPNGAVIDEARVKSISSTQYEVTLKPFECGNQFPLITLSNGKNTRGKPEYPSSSVGYTLEGSNGGISVTRTSEATPPSTGRIDVSFNQKTKRNLNISLEPKDFESELESLRGIGALSVRKEGNCASFNLTVTFQALSGDQEEMTVSNTDVVPAGTAVSVSTVVDGGLFYAPITGDTLRTASHTVPQVSLFVNDIPTACTGDCSFQWESSVTPTVTSVSPTTGTLVLGTSVVITGTGFSTDSAKNTVTIGGVQCSVTAAMATSITCDVGNGPVGEHSIIVYVEGKGNSSGDVKFEYIAEITGISPTVGSVGGGFTLTIDGYGFNTGASVTIGDANCAVTSVRPDQIQCTVLGGVDGTYDVEVHDGDAPTLSYSSFTYDSSMTATISSVTPSTLTVFGGRITVVGSSFSTTEGNVSLGSVSGTIVSWTDTEIVVDVPGIPPGSQKLLVKAPHGHATDGTGDIPSIDVDLQITSVSPQKGSLQGGTMVTITGSSFGSDPTKLRIRVGDVPCENPVVTNTRIVCKVGNAAKTHYVFNNGTAADSPYAYDPSYINIPAGDFIHFSWDVPDQVNDIFLDIIEVESPSNTTPKVGGFRGVRGKSGDFTKQFPIPGIYYMWTGYIDSYNSNSHHLTIEVDDAQSWTAEVSVNVGGFEALHVVAGASDPVDISSCNSVTSGISSCTDSLPTGRDSDKFNFAFWTCSTPSISAIDARNGTVQTSITISGEGLSTTDCQNEVSFGDQQCEVTSSSDTEVTCKLVKSGEPELGILLPVSVRVGNRGNALVAVMAAEDFSFGLIPNVETITPTFGSMAGGAHVVITGFGFGNSPLVSIGGSPCNIIESSYTKIICESPSTSVQGESDIKVDAYIDNAPLTAKCETPTKTCKFTFASLWTPSVTSIEPDNMSGSLTVTITGSSLGTNPSVLAVTIGGVSATVIQVSDTSLTATIDNLPAGDNEVIVKLKDYGKASGALSMFSHLTVTGVNPSSGSIHGGTVVTILGNGFIDGDTEVTFGGIPCEIVATSLSTVTCKTAAHGAGAVDVKVESNGQSSTFSSYTYSSASTPAISSVSPAVGSAGQTLTITGSNLNGAVTVILDDTECSVTTITNTEIQCTLGNHVTGLVPVTVHVQGLGNSNVDKKFEYLLSLNDISPTQGGIAGGQTVTLSGSGFEDSAIVTICGQPCTKIRTTSSQYICRTPANTAQVCDVQMSLNNLDKTLPDSYTYIDALTPTLSSVSPRRGGTGGGTTLTITGSGFGSNPSNVEVMIDSVACTVSSVTDTQIVCVTGQHSGSVDTVVEVQVSGNGIAAEASDGASDFSYIDVWSSVYTWGAGPLPQEGDFIIVPAGMTLLLDTDTPILGFLLIQGGKLIFDEKDLELKAKSIMITDGGLLQVGTESEPFQHKAIITLYGHPLDTELPIYGAKVLAVRNGTLDLHGIKVPVTWTRLASTAHTGINTLELEKPVEWNVGDEIIIACTSHKHSQSENEKKTIAAISDDKRTLTLDSALEHDHWGTQETFDGTTVEFRAEVGLLSHNVIFRGNDNPQWHDKIEACEGGFDTAEFATQSCFTGRFGEEIGNDGFGGMILIHSPVRDQDLAIARISYVEVTYAGQAFRLGRYPIHFHLLGYVSASYVRGCAIHQTFNRAVNIHDTHNMLVEETVIFDIRGGAFFLEDGIETGNTFQYNLAVFVRASSSLLNDDVTPAAFWATNANNTFQHNAVACGTHFGYWYRFHDHPDGPSYTPDICPKRTGLGVFKNNSVHSCGWFGLWIFPDYYPRKDPCSESEVLPAVFDGFTAYNNEKGVECVDCSVVQFKNFVLIQNRLAGYEAKKYLNVEGALYTDSGPMIKDSLIVGTTTQIPDTNQGCTKGGLIFGYGAGFSVDNVSFVNFQDSSCAAFRWARIDGTCGIYCGTYTYHTKGLHFVNTPNKAHYEWEFEGIILDKDGTATGSSGGMGWTILPTTGILPSDCIDAPEYSIGPASASMCPDKYKWHGFGFNNIKPSSLFGHDLLITSENRTSKCHFAEKRLRHGNGWVCALLDGQTYTLQFENTGDLATSNVSFTALYEGFESSDYVYTQINVPEMPDRFSIDGGATYINATEGSLDPATATTGDWIWDNDNKRVKFIVHANKRVKRGMSTYSVDRPVNLKLFKCPYPNCEPPQDPNTIPPATQRPKDFDLWDYTTLWNVSADNGFVANTGGSYGIPKAFDNVWIVNGTWVVVNKTTTFNKLGTLLIEGVLEFIDTPGAQYVIEADFIIIRCGRLIIGWPDDPFDGLASIVLRGNQSSPLFHPGDGPTLGTKAIGVFGGLDLFGQDKGQTWTELAVKAPKGSDQITLSEEVEWSVEDEIVIGPTSFNPLETEAFKITAISSDKLTLTLNSTLKYLHTAHQETLSNGQVVKVGAVVGLLTHNIKIVGQEYQDMYKDSYGARVLVGLVVNNEQTCSGYARVSNVEFYNTGQEGFTEEYDPRFSLAYLNTGTTSNVKPSFARKNSFHNGFSPAIGAIGIGGLNLTENVIYGAIGDGMRIRSDNARVLKNLAVFSVNPPTYQDRYETFNFESNSGFEAMAATQLTFQDNVVSGSERIGFHIPPVDCDDNSGRIRNNKAYANVLGGVVVTPHDTLSQTDCAKISGFTVWKTHDYGVYYQNRPSLIVEDVLYVDNRNGLFPIVIEPDSVEHLYADKTVQVRSSTFVGQTDSVECDIDITPSNDDNYKLSSKARHTMLPFPGWVGLTPGNFYKKDNGLPSHPWDGCMAYPAIGGLTIVKNVTFAKYQKNSCKSDFAVSTNVQNDDGIHPVESEDITFIDVDDSNKIFYHRPNVGKINSADCVDMDCDGHKKCLFKDMDGSFLGHVGDVIPMSEFEWDINPQRGLGDYRIPKEMVIDENGDRIPYDVKCPNKGIIRNENCIYQSSWQAYECQNDLNYEMLIIESMDEDTETRRLSPIGLLGDGYIDLINGPQDHGWCNGYTCRKRLSTFMALVATGKDYEMHFSSVTPKHMRYRLLNVDADEGVRLTVWYSQPNRLDVYVDDVFIGAKNARYDANGRYVMTVPKGDEYEPLLSEGTGANFHSKETGDLTFIIMGPQRIDVKTQESIIISLRLPSLTVDEFFGKNLAKNIAVFLGIPANKVRVVNVVSESGSGRRKRSEEETIVEVEIADEPVQNLTDTAQDPLDYQSLLQIAADIVNECQTGDISTSFNVTGECVTVNVPSSDAADPSVTYNTPTLDHMVFSEQPAATYEGTPLHKQPKIRVADISNIAVTELGIAEYPWRLTASLRAGTGHPKAMLNGTLTVNSSNGWFNFTDLVISHMGSYVLDFQVSYPTQAQHFVVTSDPFEVAGRSVKVHVFDQTNGKIVRNARFSVTLDLKDINTDETITDIAWREHTWTAEARLLESSEYASLDGTLISSFDTSLGRAMFPDLNITGFGTFFIQFRVTSNPPDFNLTYNHRLKILSPEHVDMTVEEENELKVKFDVKFQDVLPTEDKQNGFEQMILTAFANLWPGVYITSGTINEGSIVVTFSIAGTSNSVNATAFSLCDSIYNETTFIYNGHTLTLSPFLTVNDQTYYGVTCGDLPRDDEDDEDTAVWVIVIAVLIPIIVIIAFAFVVWRCTIKPKMQTHVPVFVKPVSGNTKFNFTKHGSNYLGATHTKLGDREILFKDNSFTSLGREKIESPVPPYTTSLEYTRNPQPLYYRGTPSPVSASPVKLRPASGHDWNWAEESQEPRQEVTPRMHSLHVPVSPVPNGPELREPSPSSGRASPMLHRPYTPEREGSMTPVGEDRFKEQF